MNETLELKDCFRIFNGKESERDIDLVEKVDMPTCDDIDILNRLPMSDSCIMFKVQNILMNTFLNKYFGIENIQKFMCLYCKLQNGFELAQPTPELIYCFWGNEKNPETLKDLLAWYQPSVGVMADGVTTFANLHTDAIYKLSIIRADFDLADFNYPFLGVHHKTENFHFFLKSSPQMDITIVYNDLRNTNGA